MPTLEFKGKQYIYSHHHSVPFRELLIDGKKSLPMSGEKPTLDDNLIIHGDNLHALKALMSQYAGKIRCIYIDPPYNTGNEGWCYNDNVNSPLMKKWMEKNANPVDKEDMERHDKWLCMMYPRLKLLHELLADDGVIFVSIDDNEQHHLRAMMDEIFGEINFRGKISRATGTPSGQGYGILANELDYILIYSKTDEANLAGLIFTDEDSKIYDKEDDFGKYLSRSLRKTGGEDRREDRPSMHFPIEAPDGTLVYPISPTGYESRWRCGFGKYNELKSNNLIEWKQTEENGCKVWKVYQKFYLEGRLKQPSNLWTNLEGNKKASIDIKNILGEKVFEFPKPVDLIKRCIQIVSNKDDNFIVLDSFAGSGTTAHAVLDMNKEDGGNRKFILVEMEDYADSVTAERVRRVIKGVPTAKDEKLKVGLGGSFTFCELGKEISIEKIITGESLPDYGALAQYVFYTATGKSLDGQAKEKLDYFVGATDLYEVYLIYKPDVAFLRSNDSALNDTKLKAIAARNSKKEKLVFATAKYMGQKELSAQNITFCQLPYAIHKVVGA